MAEEELRRQLVELKEQVRTLSIAQNVVHTPPTPEVLEVKAKLPIFWENKPQSWFRLVEAQFDLNGIRQDGTKYGYILSMLDDRLSDVVEDILCDPPAEGKYEHLKNALIKRLSSTKEQQVRRLLNDEELGDRKPSAFLRHLRSLAGADLKDSSIIRELWMRRLPTEVQRILITQKDLDIDKVAEIADAIVEAPSTKLVAEVNATATTSSGRTEPDLAYVMKCLNELSNKVDKLFQRGQGARSRSRSQRPGFSSRSHSTSSAPGQPKLCWYHDKFGNNATKCRTPCSWPDKNQGN
jgi:hypothetical protein